MDSEIMLTEVERALDATDQFLDTALQDEDRLQDPNFMLCLMRVRQEHKKILSKIDGLFNSSLTDYRHPSAEELRREIYNPTDDGSDSKSSTEEQTKKEKAWITDNSGMSSSLVLTRRQCWHEERSIEYTEEWMPQVAARTSQKATNPGLAHRNEKKPLRASYSHRFVNELQEKKKIDEMQESERMEHLRHKAREVPLSTYEPRFQQLLHEQEKAREARHEKAAQMLKKVRFSRTLTRLEPQNFHLRRCISAEASDWNKREAFKAKDVPISVFVPPYRDEIQATKRARRKAERAAELIRTSKAPPGLEEHAVRSRVQHCLRHAKDCENGESKVKVKHFRTVPDFKKLHAQFLRKLEKATVDRPITVVTPFFFQTDERIHSHKCHQENSVAPRMRRRSYSMGNLREYSGPGIRLNHAALLRTEANRIRAQKMERERNSSRKFWESMKERGEVAGIKLRQKFATEQKKSVSEIRRRIEEKKLELEFLQNDLSIMEQKEQQERANQYRNELKAMKQRVKARALIVEQQEMLIKMQRFERKYNETMTGARNGVLKKVSASGSRSRLTSNGSEQQTGLLSGGSASQTVKNARTDSRSEESPSASNSEAEEMEEATQEGSDDEDNVDDDDDNNGDDDEDDDGNNEKSEGSDDDEMLISKSKTGNQNSD